jgi:hypothetical protein
MLASYLVILAFVAAAERLFHLRPYRFGTFLAILIVGRGSVAPYSH